MKHVRRLAEITANRFLFGKAGRFVRPVAALLGVAAVGALVFTAFGLARSGFKGILIDPELGTFFLTWHLGLVGVYFLGFLTVTSISAFVGVVLCGWSRTPFHRRYAVGAGVILVGLTAWNLAVQGTSVNVTELLIFLSIYTTFAASTTLALRHVARNPVPSPA